MPIRAMVLTGASITAVALAPGGHEVTLALTLTPLTATLMVSLLDFTAKYIER